MNRNSLLCELEFHLVHVALEMPAWEVLENEHTCALSSFLGFGKLALFSTVPGTLILVRFLLVENNRINLGSKSPRTI